MSLRRISSQQPNETCETYETHDNGSRPFLVEVFRKHKHITVIDIRKNYKKRKRSMEPSNVVRNIVCFDADYDEIFIGEDQSQAAFKGNSLLVCTNKNTNEYVFIGEQIFKFNSLDRITQYFSRVGNSDVPYPYAIDANGNYYLMLEYVILQHVPEFKDPYDYYYDYNNTGLRDVCGKGKKFKNIIQFYLGKTPTTLKFDPNPEAKRHRILRSKQVKSVRLENGDKVTLSNNEIKELMNEYGKENGILPMKLIDLVKRE